MDKYLSTAILATGLLIWSNKKVIATQIEWFCFKVKTIYKQNRNDRHNNTNSRSRTL